MSILLEPSRDIHVIIGAASPQLRLRVFEGAFNATTERFSFTEVTSSCTFDYFAPGPAQPGDPTGRRYSSVDPSARLVTAIAPGVNLVQVRLPKSAGNASPYLIARIVVHAAINGWWLGDDSITTALDTVAHARASIYAIFDFNPAAGAQSGTVGDITGHGYVALASSNPAIFALDSDGRGLIQGLQEGTAQLTGTFMGKVNQLDVKVLNYDQERLLERVKYRGTPDKHFNILFLGEGFTSSDRKDFDKAVEKVQGRLFDAHRHSPYNRLKESFNIWKLFMPSRDRGTTVGTDLTADGQFIPFATSAQANNYTLDQLVQRVGLPSPAEAAMDVATLRSRWQGLNLFNFAPAQVSDPVVAAWKQLVPQGKLQTADTAFGLYYGSRLGDPKASSDDPANPVLAATATSDGQRYQARMFEWFQPPLVARLLTLDPRRLAREEQPEHSPLLKLIAKLVDPFETNASPHRHVGLCWAPPSGGGFARNRGLVCVIVNDVVHGGGNLGGLLTTASLAVPGGQFAHLTLNDTPGPVHLRRLSRIAHPDPDFDNLTDVVAHEFGHTFKLGDEYEEFRASVDPSLVGPRDNLAFLSQIRFAGAPANLALPEPVDPDRVPWFDLLRMDLSDAIIEPAQVAGSQLRLKLGPKRAKRWKKARDEKTEVYLRSLNVRADGAQLPVLHDDLNFVAPVQVQAIDESKDEVVIGGLEMPVPPPAMPAGSVLFIPKKRDGKLTFVVPQEVLDFMTTAHLPLSENHNSADPSGCDPVQKTPDVPIAGVATKHFPTNTYSVIGLYEGGGRFVLGAYRPAGSCKMRTQGGEDDHGKFCYVCKYLIVNRVDASQHDEMDGCEFPEKT